MIIRSFRQHAPSSPPIGPAFDVVSTPGPIAILREQFASKELCGGKILKDCLAPPKTQEDKQSTAKGRYDAEIKMVTCSNQHDCDATFSSTSSPNGPKYQCTEIFPEYSLCLDSKTHETAWGERVRGILTPYYQTMTSASFSLDYTQLDVLQGLWLRFFQRGLGRLNEKRSVLAGKRTAADAATSKMPVRLLFGLPGSIPGVEYANKLHDPRQIHELLVNGNPLQHLDIRVAIHRNAFSSWNHSKTLIADEDEILIGGINVYNNHYFQEKPVVDVAVRSRGRGLAAGILAWNDLMWAQICSQPATDLNKSGSALSMEGKFHSLVFPPLKAFSTVERSIEKTTAQFAPVVRLGRPGWDRGSQFAMSLFASLLAGAEKSISISQQDILNIGIPLSGHQGAKLYSQWPMDIIDAIAGAKLRNPSLEVRILISARFFMPSGGFYGFPGGTTTKLSTVLCESYERQRKELVGAPASSRPVAKMDEAAGLCVSSSTAPLFETYYMLEALKNARDVFLKWNSGGHPAWRGFRIAADLVWGDLGFEGWGAHTKFFSIDGKITSLGSQNFYKCDLDEYTNVFDSSALTEKIMDGFFEPLWEMSKPPSADNNFNYPASSPMYAMTDNATRKGLGLWSKRWYYAATAARSRMERAWSAGIGTLSKWLMPAAAKRALAEAEKAQTVSRR